MFSVYPPSGGGGGGLSHLHPIILPLVPCPFWGGTPVTGPRSGWGEGYPIMGYPPGQRWVTPQAGMGYPPARVRVPTPPPSRDRLCLDRLCRGRYASCGFPQEDFLVWKWNTVYLLHESDISFSKYLPLEVICEPVVNMCNFRLVLPTYLLLHFLSFVILFKPITENVNT